MEEAKKKIRSFKDLDVYQNSYSAMLIVFKHILPKLPPEEKYYLRDQLQRLFKAVPRLIAEGHSKKHQKKGFQKYLDDALSVSWTKFTGQRTLSTNNDKLNQQPNP